MRLEELQQRRLNGRYQVTALLGRGGMAAVYRAHDHVLLRDVALKLLSADAVHDASLLERFKREAVMAARLDHPNIVAVYDVGEDDGLAYSAMRLLEGRTLADLLRERGALDPATALKIITQVAAALDYAHARGIIHRDIKPGNVMLTEANASDGPRAVLTDFGIAKALDAPGLTSTGALIGTPDYMAPEQINGQPVDARTDVYALGVLAYRALTGRRPYEGSTEEVLLGHLRGTPALPSQLNPALPAAVDGAILSAIVRDPQQRPSSAGLYAAQLNAALCGSASNPTLVAPAAPPTLVATPGIVGAAANAALPQPAGTVIPASVPGSAGATAGSAVAPSFTPAPPVPAPSMPASSAPTERRAPRWLPIALGVAALALGASVAFGVGRGGNPPTQPTVVPTTAATAPVAIISTVTQIPTATPTASATATPQPSATTAPTDEPTSAPTSAPTAAPTAVPPPPPTRPPATRAPTGVPATATPTATVVAVTLTPIVMFSPTGTATNTPTVTPTPTPTGSPTPSPTTQPAACATQIGESFQRFLARETALRDALGCPTVTERTADTLTQEFAGGSMLGLDANVYVLLSNDKRGLLFFNQEAINNLPPPASPVPATEPPVEAPFRAVYERVAQVRSTLGAPKEAGLLSPGAPVQAFVNGQIVLASGPNGLAFHVLFKDTFTRVTSTTND